MIFENIDKKILRRQKSCGILHYKLKLPRLNMIKPRKKYPLREYEFAHKEPQFCTLQGREFVVPLSYNGDENKFIDDLFDKKNVLEEYHKKNETALTYVEINGYRVFVPYQWSKHKLDHQMINRMMDKAVLDYNIDIGITRIFKKITKEKTKNNLITLDGASIKKRIAKIIDVLGCKTNKAICKAVNVTTKGITVAITAPFVIAAACTQNKKPDLSEKLINTASTIAKKILTNVLIEESKNNDFAENVDKLSDNIIGKIIKTIGDKAKPLTNELLEKTHKGLSNLKNTTEENKTKAAIGVTVVFTGFAGTVAHSSKTASASNGSNSNQTEIFDARNNQKNISTPIKYKITDRASFDEAFDASLPLIHRALLATEWFSDNGYSDNNNAASNTLAGGLWWFPEDYAEKRDPTSQNWEHTKDFLSKHPNITVSYEEGMRLTEGWYTHRNTLKDKEHPKTVVDNMYERLNGCELAPHELAAIASVYYNDEECGRRLCSFVRNNYKNPVACANYISLLRPKDKSFEVGIKKRHYHEALFYLNMGNYCEKMLDFNVCSGINSKGKFFITTAVTQLELDNFEQFRQELRNECVSEETVCELTKKMCDYNPKPQSPEIKTTSIKKFLSENLDAKGLRDMTKIAGYYNKDNTTYYVQAMKQSLKRA